jgi:deoxyribodipyrimidine photo-lyase
MHLHWFRTDARVQDNTALFNAARAAKADGVPLAGLFVVSPGEWAEHDWSACKVDLLLRCMGEVGRTLAGLNVPLLVRTAANRAAVPGVVAAVAKDVGARGVFANREYEVNEAARDAAVAELGEKAGFSFQLFDDQCVVEPGAVRTQSGAPYTVFTPFKRRWMEVVKERGGVRVVSGPGKQAGTVRAGDAVPERLEGFVSKVPVGVWPAGESHARERLARFVAKGLAPYKARRDTPSIEGTSALSPYLAVGAVSARQCVVAAAEANGGKLDSGGAGEVHWISEVVWREFYRHILRDFPRVCMNRAFRPATDRIRWRDDPAGLLAWQEGRTGFPIVDAGVRQILATGWMHNRVRMIVAMFLVKDLLINWREGERFFMRHLADGDLANNNGGWQWSSGTGTDAAPYFRIYNPTTQSRTHDPEGAYIRRWVPELAKLDNDSIHEPPPMAASAAGYPLPIVDHRAARERCLAVYKGVGAA